MVKASTAPFGAVNAAVAHVARELLFSVRAPLAGVVAKTAAARVVGAAVVARVVLGAAVESVTTGKVTAAADGMVVEGRMVVLAAVVEAALVGTITPLAQVYAPFGM